MKSVLIFQSQHSNPEINKYRESQNFRRAFLRMGVHADVWHTGIKINDYDIILTLENYEFNQIPDLSECTQKKFLWVIDSHKNAPELNKYIAHNKIDVTLVAFKNHLHLFPNAVWFLPGAPADLTKPLIDQNKIHDVGFCGSRGNRGKELDELGLHQDIFVLGDAMVRAINSYKIHFNKNETPDVLAFRTMETLACGTMLLTDHSGNVEDIFINKRHLVLWNTLEEARDLIRYYIMHDAEREDIAAAGRAEFLLKHSYDVRAHTLMGMI